MTQRKISILNFKGGVGKTSLAINSLDKGHVFYWSIVICRETLALSWMMLPNRP